jgi:hypothetical protein
MQHGVKATRTISAVLLLLLLFPSIAGCGSQSHQTPALAFKVSVDPNKHDTYGLAYPITYKFRLPGSLSVAKAYKSTGGVWTELPTRTPDDYFNGIEAARFDFAHDYAYISACFDGEEDYFHICVTNGSDKMQAISFVEICDYYDERECAVAASADLDVCFGGNQYAEGAYSKWAWKCHDTRMPSTAMIITDAAGDNSEKMWSRLQAAINAGYMEAGAHSRTHPCDIPVSSDSEIGGCLLDITENLELPWWQRRGSQESISAWAEPCVLSSPEQRAKLAQYHFLCDRGGNCDGVPDCDQPGWSTWQSDGLYSISLQAFCWGPPDAASAPSTDWMNARFDYVHSKGLVLYHWGHPATWNDNADSFFDYISGKKDVWYVGFGSLYAYHYCQETGVVDVQTDASVSWNG